MFALLLCSLGVFALSWCWRFGGVVGQCGPAAPLAPACLLACSRSGVGLLACARFCVPDGRMAVR